MREFFILRGLTGCGAPFLGGGICLAGSGMSSCGALGGLEELDFTNPACKATPDAVDRVLARVAAACSPPEVLALGITLRLPGLAWRTGGIIGSPSRPALAADGSLESIGSGLWLFARPGGPGLVLGGEKGVAVRLVAELSAGQEGSSLSAGSLAGLRTLYERLQLAGLDSFLGISDGCGPGAVGVVFGQAGGRHFFETL